MNMLLMAGGFAWRFAFVVVSRQFTWMRQRRMSPDMPRAYPYKTPYYFIKLTLPLPLNKAPFSHTASQV